jgi:WD40 repeat protein
LGSSKLLRTLEGHTNYVMQVCFSADGRLLASLEADGTVRIWRCDTWESVAVSSNLRAVDPLPLAFHPNLPLLATTGYGSNAPEPNRARAIHLWQLDLAVLLGGRPTKDSVCYKNAKVVLVGDTGVGKSGLSLVLNGQAFEATDSTPGRRVWTFDSREVALDGDRKQTRETLLWTWRASRAIALFISCT